MKDLFIKLGVVALVFSIIGIASADVKVKGETVVYKAQDVTLKGYLAYDENIKGKRPGVLVVHEWWGLNDYARRRARMLAELGYTIPFPQSQWVLWLSTIGAGLFMASIFPTALALAGQHMTITGSVTGWFLICSGLGAMLFPWLIGQLIDPLGANVLPMLILGTLMIDLSIASVGALKVFTTQEQQEGK